MLDSAAASWCCACLVSVHVSAPYDFIAGNTEGCTCTMFTLIEVLSTSITFAFAIFIFISIWLLSSGSHWSICCDCGGVPNTPVSDTASSFS